MTSSTPACLPYGPGSALIVAREHDNTYAHCAQVRYGLGAVFLDDIGNCHKPQEDIVPCKEERCLALCSKLPSPLAHIPGHFCPGCHKIEVSAAKPCTVQHALKPLSGQGLEVRHFPNLSQALFGCVVHDCARKGMLAATLKSVGKRKQFL